MSADDETVQPDQIVSTALRLLPVPPHGEHFWLDLDEALEAAAGDRQEVPAAAGSPGHGAVAAAFPVVELQPDPALALVPPALRRRSNAVAAAAAVAAAVLVVVAASALVRQRSGSDVDTTELAGGGSGRTTLASPDSSDGTSGTAAPTDEAELSSQAVMSWLSALGHGDGDAAWHAMGPGSRGHLGSRSDFEDLMSALSEGWGAWAAATPEVVLVTRVPSSGDGSIVVVTLVGDVQQEGTTNRRADAFAVRVVDGVAELEPFDAAGDIEMVIPGPSGPHDLPTVEGDELIVVVPLGVDPPMVRLDDGEALVCGEDPRTELVELDDGSAQRCSLAPEGGVAPGERLLTVAFSSPGGGAISVESVRFTAA